MRVAVLSDIHGNRYALEAVIEDLKAQRAQSVIVLGDILAMGLYPKTCLDMIEALSPGLCIRGNTDEFFSTPADLSFCTAYEEPMIKQEDLSRISSWDIYRQLSYGRFTIGYCHGTPFENDLHLKPKKLSPAYLQEIAELELSMLCTGHNHRKSQHIIGRTLCMNFGAVGYSYDGSTTANYGIIEVQENYLRPIQRQVTYDTSRYIKELKKSSEDFAGYVIHTLKNGRKP